MDVSPHPIAHHLLAGAMIALDREVMRHEQRAVVDDPRDLEGLSRRLGRYLTSPLWNTWFQVSAPQSRTDLDWAIEAFLRSYPTRLKWYEALLKPPWVTIEWRDRQPFVAPPCVARWEIMANFFDADALLTFDFISKHLAAGGLSVDLPGLENWQTLAWVSDHELRQLMARGLSDMHVHVGGVRIVQSMWRDLMEGRRDPKVLRVLSDAYANDPFTSPAASEGASLGGPRSLRGELAQATEQWHRLVGLITGANAPFAPPPRSDVWWTWSSRRLTFERWILIMAWSRLLRGLPELEETALSKALYGYLGHKHRFFRISRQPLFSGSPGLRYFDEHYFRRLKPQMHRGWTGALASRFDSSPRRDFAPIADACMYLLESPNLERIELRYSPIGTAADTVRFFKFWDRINKKLVERLNEGGRKPVDIRFAIHFLRSHKGLSRPARRLRNETDRIMTELDLSSARLRLALHHTAPESQRTMAAAARIDVAGQERDTPIGQFAVHMRLLRGDVEMIRMIEEARGDGGDGKGHPCGRWLKAWFKVVDRNKHVAPPSQPILGITAHAGEDYADLLDGIFQIGVAVEYLALRPGDSLGHALALVGDAPATIRMMSLGAQLDSLCWLHDVLARAGEGILEQLQLRAIIERRGLGIYPKPMREQTPVLRTAGFDDFIWVWKHKMLPSYSAYQDASDLRRTMVDLEYDDAVIARRELRDALDPDRSRLNSAIERARDILLDEIKEHRIVVEANPASNLRVSGADQLGRSPSVKLVQQVNDGLLVCINTDNPGVFGSRIENEYALILQGLLEIGEKQGAARTMLERAREVGMTLVQ